MTENIFLSYRRDDSRGYTNAIYTLLELHFPADSIFMDVDTLVPGSDFVQSLQEAVEACDVFLAIIGSRWENIEDNKGLRRLDNPEDFVRIEIAHALKRGIPVIPVLVDGAQMPFTENLPDNIKDLARRHAFSIGDHMRSDVQRLIKVLEKTFKRLEADRLKKEKKEAELLAKQEAEQEAKAQAEAEKKAIEEKELLALQKAEQERKKQEKADAELKAKAAAEKEKKAVEEKELLALQKAEEERKKQEKADAELKAKTVAEAENKAAEEKERLALQKAEEERKRQEKADAELKAKAEAEAERKAKKERDKKARALAAAEKKDQQKRERIARQKLKAETAGSTSPSVIKKIPVWIWPAAGVVLIAIGYGIFGGFSPSKPEALGITESAQSISVDTDTPTINATTSTPIPEATINPTAVITAEPIVEPPAGAEAINVKTGAVMVYVPSGEFIMGSDSGDSDESPVHTVYLDGFWIYKTEVTNDAYRLCVEAGGCVIGDNSAEPYNDQAYADHPVIHISWEDANTYCIWAGGRLPTEAEWEKAARGTDGRTYPWGEGINDSLANYDGNIGGTSPVGSYPEGASPYGLLNMAGNAGEYVADWYQRAYYAISPPENPTGPTSGYSEVLIRGGSYTSSADDVTVTKRGAIDRSFKDHPYGFRCASSNDPSSSTLEEPITPTISPTPTPGVVSMRTSSKDGMVQAYIPAGAFLMGSEHGESNEQPVHEVYLDAYWMDEHEVSNAQFTAFLNEEGNQEEGGWTWLSPAYQDEWISYSGGEWGPITGYKDHPIVGVSWYGAKAYCEWAGRRLPTEAEWEKGARGGLEGKSYPWEYENPSCTQGAINGAQSRSCDGDTIAVMSFSPNGYGLYDMAGNVWEWVADFYDGDYYSSSPYANPQGPDSGDNNSRVLRGGSWYNYDNSLRSANRDSYYSGSSSNYIGFRCATSRK